MHIAPSGSSEVIARTASNADLSHPGAIAAGTDDHAGAAAPGADAAHPADEPHPPADAPPPKVKGLSMGVKMIDIGADTLKSKLHTSGGAAGAAGSKPPPAGAKSPTTEEPVKACDTCGCTRFQKNAFKVGHCNNCFHKH